MLQQASPVGFIQTYSNHFCSCMAEIISEGAMFM
jgi:hypothetical protein